MPKQATHAGGGSTAFSRSGKSTAVGIGERAHANEGSASFDGVANGVESEFRVPDADAPPKASAWQREFCGLTMANTSGDCGRPARAWFVCFDLHPSQLSGLPHFPIVDAICTPEITDGKHPAYTIKDALDALKAFATKDELSHSLMICDFLCLKRDKRSRMTPNDPLTLTAYLAKLKRAKMKALRKVKPSVDRLDIPLVLHARVLCWRSRFHTLQVKRSIERAGNPLLGLGILLDLSRRSHGLSFIREVIINERQRPRPDAVPIRMNIVDSATSIRGDLQLAPCPWDV